jgi:hypothetical protein
VCRGDIGAAVIFPTFFDESTLSHAGRREKKYFFHAEITFVHARATFFHARAFFFTLGPLFFMLGLLFFMVPRLFNWRLRDRGIYSLRVPFVRLNKRRNSTRSNGARFIQGKNASVGWELI